MFPSKYEEETSGSTLSQEELLEILELRESLQDCHSSRKSADILSDTRGQLEATRRLLSKAFQEEDMETARHLLDRLKFLDSVCEAAETRHESLLSNGK